MFFYAWPYEHTLIKQLLLNFIFYLFYFVIIQGHIRPFPRKCVIYFEYIFFSAPTPNSKDFSNSSDSGRLSLIINTFLGQTGLKCFGYVLTVIDVNCFSLFNLLVTVRT